MATFSVNQVNQLYVVNEVNRIAGTKVASGASAGTIRPHGDAASNAKEFYFEYKGADNVMRSDIIKTANIISAKATKASAMVTPIKSVLVKLDSSVNSGNVISGQDYILRIAFKQYVGMSDQDVYFKYGMVHGYSGMTAAQFYAKMVESLNKNFSRELIPLLKFAAVKETTLTTNSTVSAFLYEPTTTTTKIQFAVSAASEGVAFASSTYTISMKSTAKTLGDAKRILSASQYGNVIGLEGTDSTTLQAEAAAVDLAGTTPTAIVMVEVAQPWVKGVRSQVPVYYDAFPGTVTVSGDELTWGVATVLSPAGVYGNGKKIADMEYFFMGERGDQYRNVSWPRVIPTTYLVNADNDYHVLNIHYYYAGNNEGVQKSEKDITFVCSDTTKMNNLIDDVETLTGLTIEGV